MRKAFAVILFAVAMSVTAHAQIQSFAAGTMAGNMLNIYPGMPSHTTQWSGFATVRFRNQHRYHEAYPGLTQGLHLSYHHLGNNAVLGHGIGLQHQSSFEQRITRRLRLVQQLHIGGIFVTHPYDPIDNPENIVFGSRFSALISASAGMRYKWRQQALTIQASYWHSSNAHTALPNVGMNTPMLSIGWERFLFVEDVYVIDTSYVPFQLDNRWGIMVYGAYGRNEAGGTVRPTNGQKYGKQLLAAGATYRFRTIHRLSMTLEAYHDQTYRLWNETMDWPSRHPRLASSAVMAMLGHEFIFGRFGLVVQAGLNLYNPTLGRLIGEVEQRTTSNVIKRYMPGKFAVRYYLTLPERSKASLFVQAAVKSNAGQADFMELGIGTLISRPQVAR